MILIFVQFAPILNSQNILQLNVAYAEDEDSTKETEDDDSYKFDDEENVTDITTKIYKSTDQSADLLEDQFNTYSLIQDNIVSKDELLGLSKKIKKKHIGQAAQRNNKYKTFKEVLAPWFLMGLMFGILYLIFKLIKYKKIK